MQHCRVTAQSATDGGGVGALAIAGGRGAAGLGGAEIDVAACAPGELGGSELLQNGLLQP